MSIRFTDRSIKALKPRGIRYEKFDARARGFGVRVSPNGTKSWIFRYRHNKKPTRITLGTYPEMSLAEAYDEHAERRRMLNNGINPAQAERVRRDQQSKEPAVEKLVGLYIERYAKKKKDSWEEDERQLNKDVIPRWGHRKARDIEGDDVIALLDDLVDRGSPVAANRLLACIRKMYNWAIFERRMLKGMVNPCYGLKAPSKETERQRALKPKEIRAFWGNVDSAETWIAMRWALKFILVTAQRPGEVVSAEWSEFDLDEGLWTIPKKKTKNKKRPHLVPLSGLAIDILGEVQGLSLTRAFPSRSQSAERVHVTSLSAAIRRNGYLGIADFTPHDLRRTAATQMGELKIPNTIISKVLNHTEKGVTSKVYNLYDYYDEKKHALDSWGRGLNAIVTGKTTNVVSIR